MKDEYFFVNLILTFLLLVSAALLLKEALPSYWLYLFFIICGFCFSWIIWNSQSKLIKIFVSIGTLVVLFWIAYSISNSSFLYRDIILICIKGALFLEVVLSFNVCWPKYLPLMQALSIPLFMCAAFFIKDYSVISITAILGFFLCWLVTLKVGFYEFSKLPLERIDFKRNYSNTLLAVIFISSLLISGTLYFKLPFKQVIKGGIFFHNVDMQASRQVLEKEYYDLEERIQKKIIALIPTFGLAEDRYAALGWLSLLIKEASTVMEVDRALEGLVSYLKKPGLGLEPGEGQELTILLRNFVDKKIALALRQNIDEIMDTLKENPFNIKAALTISRLAHKMQNSSLLQELLAYEEQLKGVIDNSSLDMRVKKKLKELIRQLKEWKVSKLQHGQLYFEDKLKAEEAGVEQMLAPEVKKEYPQMLEKYLQIKKPTLDIGITFDAAIKITLKSVIILILCLPALFLLFYFFTGQQKQRLSSLYQDPREFIISLYRNLKELLIIFGSGYNGILAPLSYAEWIEDRYAIKNKLFLRVTAKFEEAKYSQHILKFEDAALVLNDYNDFLKILFSSQNKFYLVLRYCLTLLHRKPLSIY